MTDIVLSSPSSSSSSPRVLGLAVVGLLVGAAAGFGWWATHGAAPAPDAVPPPPPVEVAATRDAGVIEGGAVAGAATTAPGATTMPGSTLAAATAKATPTHQVLNITISGPLESAVVEAVGRRVGPSLTQVVTRTLVWWVRVPDDLLRGDTLTALYEERPGQEPVVHAVRFSSRKVGRTFEAYRYQPAGSALARFYGPDGAELEERLVDSPLDQWDQITSLLRDGRRHQGVDFRAPVGTPVRATFDGVVARKNFGSRRNGNCLELRDTQGATSALYLHLDGVADGISVGQRVKKGDVIATSGNTGHSFAPHLHYQLMRGATVLDPFKVQSTTRASLMATERPAFEAHVASQRAQLPSDVVGG